MSDLRRRIDRKLRDAGTWRFAREIGVSVLATLVGGAVISHVTRETPAPAAATSKSSERLASIARPEPIVSDRDAPGLVPRQTAAPAPAGPATAGPASAGAAPVVQAGAAVIPVRAAARPVEAGTRRAATVAALPPVRPADRTTLADGDLAAQTPEPATREPVTREPLRIFGWSVPGSDLVPTGAEAAHTVSELGRQVGRQVASAGGAIGERIGLR